MALQSWVNYDGAFMDHPLYAKWSQRLLAVLHVLWKASWPQEAQKMAGMKLTKVSGVAHSNKSLLWPFRNVSDPRKSIIEPSTCQSLWQGRECIIC